MLLLGILCSKILSIGLSLGYLVPDLFHGLFSLYQILKVFLYSNFDLIDHLNQLDKSLFKPCALILYLFKMSVHRDR